MDEYQNKLAEFLKDYSRSQCGMPLQFALRDVLGDLQIVAKELNRLVNAKSHATYRVRYAAFMLWHGII